MTTIPPGGADCACTSVWCFLSHLYDAGGVEILCLLFIALVFYKLVWKVWKKAMESKDAEIERLISERNFLQAQLFPDRESSDDES
jgi:hypothetical protein